jgi:hypothetical protein
MSVSEYKDNCRLLDVELDLDFESKKGEFIHVVVNIPICSDINA